MGTCGGAANNDKNQKHNKNNKTTKQHKLYARTDKRYTTKMNLKLY